MRFHKEYTCLCVQKTGESEYELKDMRKEKEDPASKIVIYALVDLDNQIVYALKVSTSANFFEYEFYDCN